LSPTSRSRRAAALAAVLGLAGGCSLTTTDVEECTSSAQCRSEFGVGHVCNTDDGLCEEVAPSPRCTQTYPPDLFENRLAERERIIIGNLMDRSLDTHVARENSALLAYEQANGAATLEGREFGAVFCTIEENEDFDDQVRVDAAVESARFLVNSVGVPAIVGPAASGDTQEVFIALEDSGVLMISPSATSPALTDLDPEAVSDDTPGLLWRTAPSDALQGSVIAEDMLGPGEGRESAVTQVAVIYQVGAYGEGLFEVFARAFQAGGGDAAQQFPFGDEGQLADAIADVGNSSVPEVLFISSQPEDIVDFLDAAATLPGYAAKGIFLTDAAANPDVLSTANSARFAQVRATRPAPLDESDDLVYASFIAAYSAQFREDVRTFSFAANAYDAAWLLIYGSAWALLREDGGITGQNIARGLRQLSDGEEIEVRPTRWVSVQQAFTEGRSIDITGASGSLDYDEETEETSSDIQVWNIDGEQIRGIYTVSP
jgi:branched-chain amino acid transport system substrate-binding protein